MRRIVLPSLVLLAACATVATQGQPIAPRVDYHQHLVSPAFVPIAKLPERNGQALLRELDAAGIQRAVVLSVGYSFADERKAPRESRQPDARGERLDVVGGREERRTTDRLLQRQSAARGRAAGAGALPGAARHGRDQAAHGQRRRHAARQLSSAADAAGLRARTAAASARAGAHARSRRRQLWR